MPTLRLATCIGTVSPDRSALSRHRPRSNGRDREYPVKGMTAKTAMAGKSVMIGRQRVEELVRLGRDEVFLEDELERVGQAGEADPRAR